MLIQATKTQLGAEFICDRMTNQEVSLSTYHRLPQSLKRMVYNVYCRHSFMGASSFAKRLRRQLMSAQNAIERTTAAILRDKKQAA